MNEEYDEDWDRYFAGQTIFENLKNTHPRDIDSIDEYGEIDLRFKLFPNLDMIYPSGGII
jgi:molecular chaperone GrpE (heat shock protein)